MGTMRVPAIQTMTALARNIAALIPSDQRVKSSISGNCLALAFSGRAGGLLQRLARLHLLLDPALPKLARPFKKGQCD